MRRIRPFNVACAVSVSLCVLCLVSAASATQLSANARGSVFIVPNIELRWDANSNLVQDTFIHLHNGYPQEVRVFMFFVNGDPPLPADGKERPHPGWNRFNTIVSLAANQPAYWSALTGMGAPSPVIPPFTILDLGSPPGRPDPEGTTDRVLRGFLVGWAINFAGEEIRWNHLAATATVIDFRTGGAWQYNAYHARSVNDDLDTGDATGTPGVLNLDGIEFAAPHDTVMFNFPAEGAQVYSSSSVAVTSRNDLTLHPAGVDLRQDGSGPVSTNADVTIWNGNEVQFNGLKRCIACWDQTLLQIYGTPNYFDRSLLQTEIGWAEIDGRSDPKCVAQGVQSINASLVGVLSRRSIFGTGIGAEVDYAGYNLSGRGLEPAIIRYDVPDDPPERHAASAGTEQPNAPAAQAAVNDATVKLDHQRDTADSTANDRGLAIDSQFSINEPGNLVYISKIDARWDAQGNLMQDTFVHLTNTSSMPVRIQMYFVNGDDPLPAGDDERPHPGWNVLNTQIDLTPHQPVSWSAVHGDDLLGVPQWVDLDPGPPPGRPDPTFGGRMLRGFIVAWAVDELCREVAGDALMADAMLINYHSVFTYTWGYHGHHLPNIADVPFGEPSPTPGVLEIGNLLEFPAGFAQLSFISPTGNSNAYDVQGYVVENATDATLHQVSADFTAGSPGPFTSRAHYLIWNQNESLFTGMYTCVTCWDQSFLTVYPAPILWPVTVLETNVAAAQIDGSASVTCDGESLSVDASMLGLVSNVLFIDGLVNEYAWVGHNMFGQGEEEAEVRAELCEPCPWDIATPGGPGMDGNVNVFDLLLLLENWGTNGPGAAIAPNVNIVDVFDLIDLLAHWGPCP